MLPACTVTQLATASLHVEEPGFEAVQDLSKHRFQAVCTWNAENHDNK